MQILADDRERPSGIIDILERTEDVLVRVARLPEGDYLVDDEVLVERKAAADFAASILDGRLFKQANRMCRSPFHPAMILEGSVQEWRELGVKREALQGALISLSLVFRIAVLRSANPEETARLIVCAGRQLLRCRTTGSPAAAGRKAKRINRRKLKMLQQLPGIGPERAARLLARFGTVRGCVDATAEELVTVDGIGETTARGIVETVN